jgi:hypothetical protein
VNAFRVLERYARGATAGREPRCELCAGAIAPSHGHVVDVEARRIHCGCTSCALLFSQPAAGGRYRTVPSRILTDDAFELTDEQWSALGVPVRMAFFFRNTPLGAWVSVYPSPAGPTEAEVDEAAFADLVATRPLAASVEPDVEALLVRSPRGGAFEALLVPIDAAYELVGVVRRHWKGFDGGEDARAEIDRFFAGLRARSRPLARGGDR